MTTGIHHAIAGLVLTVLTTLCSAPGHAAERLTVVAVHNTPSELALKARLEQLVEKHQLGKCLYTGDIRIDKDVWPPHSHPVLTLGVSDAMLGDDLNLAGVLPHDVFHWNMVLNSNSCRTRRRHA